MAKGEEGCGGADLRERREGIWQWAGESERFKDKTKVEDGLSHTVNWKDESDESGFCTWRILQSFHAAG